MYILLLKYCYIRYVFFILCGNKDYYKTTIEQLTDRTLCKSKLMWKSESSLPLFLILSMLSFLILDYKISNDTQPPDCNVHQQFMETEEMRNPVPDKLTLRSKGKITRLYIQYRHTVMDRKEQLTDRTLHTNKLN